MYVFNLDLSSLIFLKSGRERNVGVGWQGEKGVQPVRTTDRYKIRAVIPTAKQRAGGWGWAGRGREAGSL